MKVVKKIWNIPLSKTKITYVNGKTEIYDSLSFIAIDTKPTFYPVETLQFLLGEKEGLKEYNRRNKEYKVLKVEYI